MICYHNNQVIIEKYSQIIRVTENIVTVNQEGFIDIIGKDLKVVKLSSDEIVINGKITRIDINEK